MISKILHSELSRSEMNQFIRFCASFSAAYLVSRRSAGKLSAEYIGDDNTEIQKLAMDSIAELFGRDNQNNFYQLQEYYQPLELAIIQDANEALFMTRRLVVAHTKQSLAKRTALNDPAGAKIYRNLALVPQRDSRVKMHRFGDNEYFFKWDKSDQYSFPQDFHPNRPEVAWDRGLLLLGEGKSGSQIVLPAYVLNFLDRLSQDSDHRHFISRSLLFKLLKQIIGFQTTTLSDYENLPASSTSDGVSESDQQEFLQHVKAFHRSEIDTRYGLKRKLSQSEVTVYCQILDQYFEDLLMDGSPRKLPDYRNESAFRDLEEVNWRLHRGRLEYIIKMGRKALQDKYHHDFLKSDTVVIEDK